MDVVDGKACFVFKGLFLLNHYGSGRVMSGPGPLDLQSISSELNYLIYCGYLWLDYFIKMQSHLAVN